MPVEVRAQSASHIKAPSPQQRFEISCWERAGPQLCWAHRQRKSGLGAARELPEVRVDRSLVPTWGAPSSDLDERGHGAGVVRIPMFRGSPESTERSFDLGPLSGPQDPGRRPREAPAELSRCARLGAKSQGPTHMLPPPPSVSPRGKAMAKVPAPPGLEMFAVASGDLASTHATCTRESLATCTRESLEAWDSEDLAQGLSREGRRFGGRPGTTYDSLDRLSDVEVSVPRRGGRGVGMGGRSRCGRRRGASRPLLTPLLGPPHPPHGTATPAALSQPDL